MQTVLIDLDTLLDTRLGTLSSINAGAAKYVVSNDRYWFRENDHWDILTNHMVTQEEFDQAYATRDYEILKQSIMTNILVVIHKMLAEFNVGLRDGVNETDIGIEINLHPYDLPDETRYTLEEILRRRLYRDLPIKFCSRPMETLTPASLTKNYVAWVTYDFHAWIKRHCFSLGKHPSADFTLIVPRLFEKDVSNVTKDKKKEQVLDLKLWLAGYINLEFIDVNCFSMFRVE